MDTIAVRGPVDPASAHKLPRQRLRREVYPETGEVFDLVTSAKAYTTSGQPYWVDSWRSSTPEVRVEFSVPKYHRPDNRRPATAEEVVAAVAGKYDEIGEVTPWRCTLQELDVVRIDIARDFENVEDPPAVIRALADTRGLRTRDVIYPWNDGPGVTALRRGVERWHARVYWRQAVYRAHLQRTGSADRSALAGLLREESEVVRFELQLRREAARGAGMATLGDISEAALAAAAHQYFVERCRFGDVLAGPDVTVRRAVDMHGGDKVVTALGQWVADACGVDGGSHSRTAERYRAEYRKLGLHPADFGRPERAPVCLDFHQGVVRPAA